MDIKIKILGVGNILFGDEGFGVWFVKKYEDFFNEKYGDYVTLIDAGTTTIPVITETGEVTHLFIIDAVKVDNREFKPGDVLLYEKEAIFSGKKSRIKVTAHSGGVQEILATMELMETLPEYVKLIGFVPADISTSMNMTEDGHKAMEKVRDALVEEIDAILEKEGVV